MCVIPANRDARNDCGQVTVLFALVLIVVMIFIAGIAVAGRVAVERARAHTAADAVALASADPVAQQELMRRWAEQGAAVRPSSTGAHATSGRAQAQSWVRPDEGSVTRSPALVAIIARAEQLLGGAPLIPLRWHATEIVLSPDDAARFEIVAADFAMCSSSTGSGAVVFALC